MSRVQITYQAWSGQSPQLPEPKVIDVELTGQKSFTVSANKFEESDDANLSLIPNNEGQVSVKYSQLILREENKGLDLNGQKEGDVSLDKGQSIKFSTPTMDAGASVTIEIK